MDLAGLLAGVDSPVCFMRVAVAVLAGDSGRLDRCRVTHADECSLWADGLFEISPEMGEVCSS